MTNRTYNELLIRWNHLTHDINRCNDDDLVAELLDERSDIERQMDEFDMADRNLPVIQ